MPGFQNGKEIYRDDCVVFHRFSKGRGNPILIVPPHAGRGGWVVQPLIDALAQRFKGKRSVCAFELLPATREASCISVAGLIDALDDGVDLFDRPVDLLGQCQGGWLSAMYTALHQEKVNRLATFVAPINLKTGEKNIIEDYCRTIDLDAHQQVVDFYGGIQPGVLQWLAFAGVNPYEVFIGRFVKQAQAIWQDDKKAIATHARNNAWYDAPQDLASWFMQALRHHFTYNQLYTGEWEISPGVIPRLSDITCDVWACGGDMDDITHPRQAEGLIEKVSSERKHFHLFRGAGRTAPFTRKACITTFMNQFYEA